MKLMIEEPGKVQLLLLALSLVLPAEKARKVVDSYEPTKSEKKGKRSLLKSFLYSFTDWYFFTRFRSTFFLYLCYDSTYFWTKPRRRNSHLDNGTKASLSWSCPRTRRTNFGIAKPTPDRTRLIPQPSVVRLEPGKVRKKIFLSRHCLCLRASSSAFSFNCRKKASFHWSSFATSKGWTFL